MNGRTRRDETRLRTSSPRPDGDTHLTTPRLRGVYVPGQEPGRGVGRRGGSFSVPCSVRGGSLGYDGHASWPKTVPVPQVRVDPPSKLSTCRREPTVLSTKGTGTVRNVRFGVRPRTPTWDRVVGARGRSGVRVETPFPRRRLSSPEPGSGGLEGSAPPPHVRYSFRVDVPTLTSVEGLGGSSKGWVLPLTVATTPLRPLCRRSRCPTGRGRHERGTPSRERPLTDPSTGSKWTAGLGPGPPVETTFYLDYPQPLSRRSRRGREGPG